MLHPPRRSLFRLSCSTIRRAAGTKNFDPTDLVSVVRMILHNHSSALQDRPHRACLGGAVDSALGM